MENESRFYNLLEMMRKDLSLSPMMFKNIIKFFKESQKEYIYQSIKEIKTDNDILFLLRMSFVSEEIDSILRDKNIKHKELVLKIGKKNFEYKHIYEPETNYFFTNLNSFIRVGSKLDIKDKIFSISEIRKHYNEGYQIHIRNTIKKIRSENRLEFVSIFKNDKKKLKEAFLSLIRERNISSKDITDLLNHYSEKINFSNKENPFIVYLESQKISGIIFFDTDDINKPRDDFYELIDTFIKKGFLKNNRKFKKSLEFAKNSFIKSIRIKTTKEIVEKKLNNVILKHKFLLDCKD